MIHASHQIAGGIYLVLNPAVEQTLLLGKLKAALSGGIQVVQIWNNWPANADKLRLIESIAQACIPHNVPLFIDNDWALLQQTPLLQGVHLDTVPNDWEGIKQTIGRPFLAGITCSGNLDTVIWADAHGLDYVSFCAMFPSPSAGSCDIVMPATVRQARTLTRMPIFVSGGITPQNIVSLKKETPFNGVAVISGLLSAEHPEQKVQEYQHALGINHY